MRVQVLELFGFVEIRNKSDSMAAILSVGVWSFLGFDGVPNGSLILALTELSV